MCAGQINREMEEQLIHRMDLDVVVEVVRAWVAARAAGHPWPTRSGLLLAHAVYNHPDCLNLGIQVDGTGRSLLTTGAGVTVPAGMRRGLFVADSQMPGHVVVPQRGRRGTTYILLGVLRVQHAEAVPLEFLGNPSDQLNLVYATIELGMPSWRVVLFSVPARPVRGRRGMRWGLQWEHAARCSFEQCFFLRNWAPWTDAADPGHLELCMRVRNEARRFGMPEVCIDEGMDWTWPARP